jgi:hypothetical protein
VDEKMRVKFWLFNTGYINDRSLISQARRKRMPCYCIIGSSLVSSFLEGGEISGALQSCVPA